MPASVALPVHGEFPWSWVPHAELGAMTEQPSHEILLPQEVELEDAEAIEKQGLLEIHLPKIDKEKRTNLKVKSL